MTASFRLLGLDPAPFEPLFELTDEQLREHGALRRIADTSGRYPCRISLQEADAGEELLLLPFAHLRSRSPYQSSGPIFVRRGVPRHDAAPGEVPEYVAKRVISLRGYDGDDLMIDAGIAQGAEATAAEIRRLLANPSVSYLHLHNAMRGCYSCKAVRV